MNDPGRKGAVLIVVIAAHGVMLFAVTGLRSPKRDTAEPKGGILFFVEPLRRKSQVPAQPFPRTKATNPRARSSDEVTRSADDRAITIVPSPEQTTVDWAAERERVSGDIVATEVAKSKESRLFSKPKTIELPRGSNERGPGVSQTLGSGEIITWTSDDCYVTNSAHASPQLDPKAVNTICKPKRKPTRDDLFDHLKPKYLLDPGEELPTLQTPR